jgi:hypothetical protein
MALAASCEPDRPNDGGLDIDGDGNVDTFQEIAQEAVDWLAYAQGDFGNGEGGWDYWGIDNGSSEAEDNSNSGYAVLGLAYAEGFGCTIPPWVRTELNVWIGNVQDPVNGDVDDGGSWYRPVTWPWVNELKTGNLIFEMTFVGDDPSAQRFQDALDYIERHWRDANLNPGWGYDSFSADYQAMYCLMKGLEYSGIDLIDTDGDGQRDDDWFNQEPPAIPPQDFATVLVAQQHPDGFWPSCHWGDEPVLCTTWALLTLEKAVPPLIVPVDIKPQSCPNPISTKDKGVLPVAILGTDEFDIETIDPASVTLEGVSPVFWALEDVATPYEPFIGKPVDRYACTEEGPDGFMDLTLKFEAQEIIAALGEVEDGDVLVLHLDGALKEGDALFAGEDVVWILKKGN